MAIVDMKKISVIGLGNDKEQIIKEIMKAGTVEISDIDMGDDSQLTEIFRKDSVKGQVTELDEKLSKVKAVIEDLSVYDTTKKGLFQSKRTISAADYKRITGDVDSILLIADEILKYNDRLSELKVQENKLNNLIETLNPWKPSNVPFDMTSTRNTVIVFGVAPATVDISDLKSNINENVPESYIQVISSDKDQHYLIIIYHCLVEEEPMNALKPYGFNKVIFNEIKGTANKNIIQADHDINQIIKEREKINKIISQMAVHKAELEVVYDYLMIQKDRKEAIGKLLKSENTFVMEGWLPYDEADKLKDKILSKWDAVVEVSQAEEGEDFPILLRNHSMVKPFEMVTELYSLPKPGGVDPTAVMSIFLLYFSD